jgi:signal transduction histidine kinase
VLKRTLSLLFPLFFILVCMHLSYIPQHNPKNTMTMFLLGSFAVAILWLYDYWETLLVSIGTFAGFIAGIFLFSEHPPALYGNIFICLAIVVAFYCISRITFAVHYNSFLQYKTIESINQALEKTNRQKTDILGVVAHDLRSPISNVEGLLHLLQMPGQNDADREMLLGMIGQSCHQANGIIHDLLEVSRATETQQPTELTLLNELLQNAHRQWQQGPLQQRTLSLQLPDQPVLLQAYPGKIERMLNNLLSNAIKFTAPDGHIELALEVKPEGQCTITVTDNGIGIPAELLPHLFDRYSKASRKGLNGQGSVGLGMHITRELAQLHGGHIAVSSVPKKGTRFTVTLPV